MLAPFPLAAAFFETCRAPKSVGEPVLEAALRQCVALARAAHPRVALDDLTFVRHLGGRLTPDDAILDALALLKVTDLFVARACAAADPHALVAFEDEGMRHVDGAAVRKGISRDTIEEAKQNVRERLLVGDGEPGILGYNGRGDLRAWLRIAVVREAVHIAKQAGRERLLTFELFSLADAGSDPELGYFKARYRSDYKAAFETAIAQLDARQRSLLRQQCVLGMTVDQIAGIYQVHRATAARWVQSAREELLAKARFELGRQTGLSHAELEGIVRMIESQLNVSFQRLLMSRSRGGP